MLASLIVLVVLVLGSVVAVAVSGQATAATRTREIERRLRWVARHPEQANSGDVEALLRRELPADEVASVCARAAVLGVAPLTMWAWADRFGVRSLAFVIGSGLGADDLVARLEANGAPATRRTSVRSSRAKGIIAA